METKKEENEESSGSEELEEEGVEERELRYRKGEESSEEEEDMFTAMKVGSDQELPCHPNIIICIILSFIFIVICLFIYSVYYLIMYKRTQDEQERLSKLYPHAREHLHEHSDYTFKPLRLPQDFFTQEQDKIRDKKYRLVVGALWDRYSHEVEEILREINKQIDEGSKYHRLLMVLEHYENNIHSENFKTVKERVEKEDGNFLFMDAAKYRFNDHYRDNPNVDYTISELPNEKQRQLTCDTIAMFTHVLQALDFDYFMLFSLDSKMCEDALTKVTVGLTFFDHKKDTKFCALRFSRDLSAMVFSKSGLIDLTKYLQGNIDKHSLQDLVHDFLYSKDFGQDKVCQAFGGLKNAYSYRYNLVSKSSVPGYPECHFPMKEVRFLHDVTERMYDSRCEIKNIDFSPCRDLDQE